MSELNELRILVADDHALIRGAIAATIRRGVPGAKCEQVGNASAVMDAVKKGEWRLLVLDLGLPGGTELETLRAVRALHPRLPILVFSMFPEEKMGVAAIEAGADGYLCKTADRSLVIDAVTETLAGRGFRSPRLAELLAQRGSGAKGPELLSRRELEVLIFLGRGLSNKEIAARLEIGVTSVGTYRARVMQKLGLATTADLLRYVVEHRLARE